MTNNKTVKTRILSTLEKGTELSVKQARRMFNARNIAQRIFELRMDGYDIRTNVKMLKNGSKKFFYSLNTRSRKTA